MKKTYGPYKGSKQNNGRPVMVEYDSTKKPNPSGSKTTSTNAARHAKEKALGRKLPKSKHVAHRSGTNKGGSQSISPSSTTVQSAAKNIGDGNKNRGKKK